MAQRGPVVAVFPSQRQADLAVHELRRAGFRGGQIKVAVPENNGRTGATARVKRGTRQTESTAEEAVRDVLAGAGAGAAPVRASTSAVEIGMAADGVLGSLVDSVRRAAAAAADSVTSTLTSMGFLDNEADFYERQFQAGRAIVAVRVRRRREEAAGILQRCGGYDAASQSPEGK
jgi:hypothetical protein